MQVGLTPEQALIVATIISAVIGAGIRKVWVWGWAYRDMEEDRDFWRDTALKSMSHVDKALGSAKVAIEKVGDA